MDFFFNLFEQWCDKSVDFILTQEVDKVEGTPAGKMVAMPGEKLVATKLVQKLVSTENRKSVI